MKLNQIKAWSQQTSLGRLALGITWLGLAYVFASLAIDSGSWWQWLIAFVVFIYALSSFVKSAINLVKPWIKKNNLTS